MGLQKLAPNLDENYEANLKCVWGGGMNMMTMKELSMSKNNTSQSQPLFPTSYT